MSTARTVPRGVTRERLVTCGWVAAVVASALDLVILGSFHLLQPEVDELTAPTSAYVHGTAGALARVGTAAAGVGAAGLVVALAAWGAQTRRPPGLALLTLFGVTKLVQTFSPIDPEGMVTVSGTVHNVTGNIAFFVLPVAAVLVGRAVAAATDRVLPSVLAWIVVATTLGVLVGGAADLFGLVQRVYLVSAALWVGVTAVVLGRNQGR